MASDTKWRLLAALAFSLLLITGCGGGGNEAPTAAQTGSARFTISWPERARVLPEVAESMRVRLWQGSVTLGSQTVDRPAAGLTSTVVFDPVPIGTVNYAIEAYTAPGAAGLWAGTAEGILNISGNGRALVSVDAVMQSTINRLVIAAPGWDYTVQPGETLQLVATAYNSWTQVIPIPAGHLSWRSSNPAVASVDAAIGRVLGRANGTTVITVTDNESAVTGSITVTVGSSPPITPDVRVRLFASTANIYEPRTLTVRIWEGDTEVTSFQARWDYDGDGTYDTTFSPSGSIDHQFTQVGIVSPRVETRLQDGRVYTASAVVRVADEFGGVPSVSVRVEPETPTVATDVTFRVTVWDSGDQNVHEGALRWDWEDDGTYDTPYIPFSFDGITEPVFPVITHVFSSPGIHLVRVQREGHLWSELIVVNVSP